MEEEKEEEEEEEEEGSGMGAFASSKKGFHQLHKIPMLRVNEEVQYVTLVNVSVFLRGGEGSEPSLPWWILLAVQPSKRRRRRRKKKREGGFH